MKTLAMMIIVTLSQMVVAGPGKFDSSEFNNIIQDNQKNEKILQADLQKHVGIELPNEAEMGKISEEHRLIEGTVEQVAVKTSKLMQTSEQVKYQDGSDDLKRVSQEVKEIFGN